MNLLRRPRKAMSFHHNIWKQAARTCKSPPVQVFINSAPSELLTATIVAAGRWRGGRKKKVASESDEETEAKAGEDELDDVLVPDIATQKFANWSISYRGRWTRWGGRHSLPPATLKAAARR